MRQIRDDAGRREVLELKRMPSADATGDFLRRGRVSGGWEALEPRVLRADGIKRYTLDMDATGNEAGNNSSPRRLMIRRPVQQPLFDGVQGSEKYTTIATNIHLDLPCKAG